MTVTLDLAALKSDSHTRRSLSDLSLSVAKCKKIVVVTGAGISCSSGIPDFRSSDGLYALVKQQFPDVVLKGRDLFDASLFRDSTSTAVFYTFISQLKQSCDAATPTPTHHFIKTLDSKKRLLRSYTQNIDGLEARVGILSSGSKEAQSSGKGKSKINTKAVRNVQLHGDIHRVRCISCSAEYPCTADHLAFFNDGKSPDCPECLQRSEARVARSARPIKVGTLRPAIVLYDEPHPLGDDIGTIQTSDISRKPDMLIIMGTSLKVHGLKKLVKDFAKTVHASCSCPTTSKAKSWAGKVVFVNRTPPSAEWSDIIDYHVAGETDVWTEKVVEDWKKMRPADWEVQQTLVAGGGDVSIDSMFKTVKAIPVAAAGVKGKPKDVKKKTRLEEENIPPSSSMDMILSTPDASSSQLPTKMISSPGSPSKRRQTASHYTLESSPSKKRTQSLEGAGLEPEARGLLFGDSTNQTAHPDAFDEIGTLAEDLSMHDINSPPRKMTGRKVVDLDLSMQEIPSPPRKTVGRKMASRPATRKAPLRKTSSVESALDFEEPKTSQARTRKRTVC